MTEIPGFNAPTKQSPDNASRLDRDGSKHPSGVLRMLVLLAEHARIRAQGERNLWQGFVD